MTKAATPGSGEPTLEDLPELLTLKQACEATHLSDVVIRSAIKRKELPAFIPGGRDARAPGRSLGYRIYRKDLQAWFFGSFRRGS